MVTPAVVLVDGEHYPPVVAEALARLSERGYQIVAGLFAGGTEKTASLPDLGLPLEQGDPERLLPDLIQRYQPAVVLDLSDEPVIGNRLRMRLAALALLGGVAYEGAGFRFDPPPEPRLTERPTVAVIGTGKRTGKTAVSIELARHWRVAGRRVCIVTMGRGGPEEPMLLRASDFAADADALLRLSEAGLHAASDYVEDAVFAGVDTVGTRRCGAGLSGQTVTDNFAAGVRLAEELDPELIIYEGSGTAVPPAAADATVLVAMSDLDPENLHGYLGPVRLGKADALVLLDGAGESNSGELERIAKEVNPTVAVLRGRMVPEPRVSVAGRQVLLVTTAKPGAAEALRVGLSELGAAEVHIAHGLADRRRLVAELDGHAGVDLVLVEVKAAAVDTVIPWARERAVTAGLVHNRVELADGLARLAGVVEVNW